MGGVGRESHRIMTHGTLIVASPTACGHRYTYIPLFAHVIVVVIIVIVVVIVVIVVVVVIVIVVCGN